MLQQQLLQATAPAECDPLRYQQTFHLESASQDGVEDTKGNPGEDGLFLLTNLRLIWMLGRDKRTNLSIGLDTIQNISIKSTESRLTGAVRTMSILTKFNQSKFEFIFAASAAPPAPGTLSNRENVFAALQVMMGSSMPAIRLWRLVTMMICWRQAPCMLLPTSRPRPCPQRTCLAMPHGLDTVFAGYLRTRTLAHSPASVRCKALPLTANICESAFMPFASHAVAYAPPCRQYTAPTSPPACTEICACEAPSLLGES